MDDTGDQVGRVRDVVITNRASNRAPRVKGLVCELLARRQIFFPMERIHTIDTNQVVISGVVNTKRFARREREMLVVADLFDAKVVRRDDPKSYTVFDVGFKLVRAREWEISEIALREANRPRPWQRGAVQIVPWTEIPQLSAMNEKLADQLVARLTEMPAADVARELHDMTPQRRAEVVRAMDDEIGRASCRERV